MTQTTYSKTNTFYIKQQIFIAFTSDLMTNHATKCRVFALYVILWCLLTYT